MGTGDLRWGRGRERAVPLLLGASGPGPGPFPGKGGLTRPSPSLCAPEQASFLPGEDGAKPLRLLPVSFPVASGHRLALRMGALWCSKEKKNSFLPQQAVPGQPWSGGGGALLPGWRTRALQVTALPGPAATLSFRLQLVCG